MTRVSKGLRSPLIKAFSDKKESSTKEFEDKYKIIRDLEDSFSILMDQKNKYSSFKMETLLECTQTSNEVRILTAPKNFMFSSTSVFEKVKKMLSGAELVFNFDPSYFLQIDRKMLHLQEMEDLKKQGQVMQGQSFAQELECISPSHMDEGFYRNIFKLNFADECQFDLELMKDFIKKTVNEQTAGDLPKGKEQQHLLRLAQTLIWTSLTNPKDFFFVNSNIKMLFEYTLLDGFDRGSIFNFR